jgi:DNA-binding PadR family transcriptional regulator
MERELLLLGMLRIEEMHGYQADQLINSHLEPSFQLKKPTMYKLLNKMVDQGWITFREEQEGNYPVRRVYAITSAGEEAFQQLLRQSLADYRPVSFNDIALAFLDSLPAGEALPLLRRRRESISHHLETTRAHDPELGAHQGGYQLLLLHQIQHLSAELAWMDELLDHLQGADANKNLVGL